MGTFQQSQATRTYDRGVVRVHMDGSMSIQVLIKDATGATIDTFNLHLPVSGPITDEGGKQIAGSTPAAIKTTRQAFADALDAAIDNAAAAGKFAR